MRVKAQDLIDLMNVWAPQELAERWDFSGLQVGNPEQNVDKVLVALDLTEDNVDYAISQNISMIITHHPFLFKAVHGIDTRTYKGRIIEKLLKHNIVSFAAHTNLDTAKEGVNDVLADVLDLKNREGLIPAKAYPVFNVKCYLQHGEETSLIKFLNDNYRYEAAYIQSRPISDSLVKVEFNVKSKVFSRILHDITESGFSFDYDIYEVKNHSDQEFMGRIGVLEYPLSGREALSYIKERLGIPVLRFAGNTDITVRKVAVLGGAGSEFAAMAKSRGADLYLTGDLKYHEAQDAVSSGLLIADGGHFYTERIIIPQIALRIKEEACKKRWNLTVIEDPVAKDIFDTI